MASTSTAGSGPVSDVVVIGGGISGVAAAYELARHGVGVTLLERGDLASMASGWTLAGVRQSGRHPAELPLARAAVTRWSDLSANLGADVEYRQEGNLRLARNADEVGTIQAIVAEQRTLGLDLSFLPDNAAVRDVAPAIAASVLAASFCPSDGHANPTATVRAFAGAAARHGATICPNTAVSAIEVHGGRVIGVRAGDGRRFGADAVVVTAGVYTGDLLAPLGLDLPLRLAQVPVVQTVPVPPLLAQVLGVATADFAGRQQADGRFRVTGGGAPWPFGLGDLAGGNDLVQPTAQQIQTTIARGIEVLPALAEARVARVWGGLLDMTPDALPVIELVPEVAGLVVAAGFSGHGFCLGPITGQIARELVLDGRSSLPIEPFRRARFDGRGVTPDRAAAATLHG
jgi:sarcosine oxidase subunit beta